MRRSPAIIAAVDTFSCDRCNAAYDPNDNFCRRCGQGLASHRLPAVRPPAAVTTAQPGFALPRSLVRSVAVLAVGTGLEWVTRRLMGTAAKAAGRALVSGVDPRTARHDAKAVRAPQELTVDELIYVRKVSLRR